MPPAIRGVASTKKVTSLLGKAGLTARVLRPSRVDAMNKVLILLITIAVLSAASLAQQIKRDPKYPAHWWTPINDPKKPDW